MEIATARLRLRPLTTGDAADLVRSLSDWNVSRWLSALPFPYGDADAAWWIDQVRADHATGRPTTFAIACRDDDRLIGCVGCGAPSGLPDEVGYWLDRAQWGQGLASEALSAVLDHAFGTLGASRLHAFADAENAGSRRVLEKAGFVATGHRTDLPSKLGSRLMVVYERGRTPPNSYLDREP